MNQPGKPSWKSLETWALILETEIAVIKAQVEALQESADETKESTDKLCDMFQGFRGEVRLQWERDKVREETIREIKNESAG